ncbi:MAG: hypothetical protein AAF799_41180 [Myxococcota bacterium]
MNLLFLQTMRLQKMGLSTSEAIKTAYLGKMIAGDDVGMSFFVTETLGRRALEDDKPSVEPRDEQPRDEEVPDGSTTPDGGTGAEPIGVVGRD